MMQDDSNGESSFEFVERKIEGISLVDNAMKQGVPHSAALIPPKMTSSGLGAVEPPSALPSFIEPSPRTASESATKSPPSTSVTAIAPSDTSSYNPAASAFYPKTFSPVIPASKGSDASLSTVDSIIDSDPNAGVSSQLLGWVKGAVGGSAGILSRVTEKAKSSMNSMITTLDPQMKEFIYSGGAVDIIVASDKEVKVSPVREAFQSVFGKATVTGMPVNTSTAAAAQPVGFAAGVKAAEERLSAVRSAQNIPPEQTVLAVENFLVEIGENKWFDVGVLILSDPARGITLETFTQLTPVPAAVVALAQEDTPAEYPLRWSGLSVTVGSIMANNLQVPHTEWHQALTGVSRSEMILLAAKVLAGLYKSSVGPIL
ncbi:Protein PRRC1 [Frankliniella fusca]|uniref:Protein PRRC1 n=1 Tax=Frankliniella fusca TaxID=407009 RepID=A0AAE1I636_9NEOP|nr:Protein PRRC1 [Frankliniella fusca]